MTAFSQASAQQTDLDRALERARKECAELEAAVKAQEATISGEEAALSAAVDDARLDYEAARAERQALASANDEGDAQVHARRRDLEESRRQHERLRAVLGQRFERRFGRAPANDRAIEDIARALLEAAKDDLLAAREFRLETGHARFPDGTRREVRILRAGALARYYRDADGAVGFLVEDQGEYEALADALDAEGRRAVRQAFADLERDPSAVPAALPLDVTGGRALAAARGVRDWRATWASGGWVMYPLAALAALLLLVTMERLWRLWPGWRRGSHALADALDAGVFEKLPEALRASSPRHPLAQLVGAALASGGEDPATREAKLALAGAHGAAGLERGLGLLGLVATLAPFLGLLGTVTGMIATFQALTLFGSGDPAVLSSGISEALVSTQAGLVVAVPAVVLHAVLSARVDALALRLEQSATALLEAEPPTKPLAPERGP